MGPANSPAGGQPLPPVGVVADLGHAAFGADRDARAPREPVVIPGLPPALMRTYEDHVLGKVYADWSFERASRCLAPVPGPRPGPRAGVRGQAVPRSGRVWRASSCPPASSGHCSRPSRTTCSAAGGSRWPPDGPVPLLIDLYESLIAAARRMAEVLGLEDVVALEQRTALADMGQYVAHRQVLQVANRLEAGLPRHKVKPLAGRQEVPTRVLDEDTYPVGGFSSISTKGTRREPAALPARVHGAGRRAAARPVRRQVPPGRAATTTPATRTSSSAAARSFVFCLFPDLVRARFKDPDLPAQRIVLVLGLLLTAVKKLSEWLSTDALKFEFLLVQDGEAKPLAQEGALLEMLFREQIENGTVDVRHFAEAPGPYADRRAQRSLCHLLAVSAGGAEVGHRPGRFHRLDGRRSAAGVRIGYDEPTELPGDDPVESWTATLERSVGGLGLTAAAT